MLLTHCTFATFIFFTHNARPTVTLPIWRPAVFIICEAEIRSKHAADLFAIVYDKNIRYNYALYT